jgi:hypothetical protein
MQYDPIKQRIKHRLQIRVTKNVDYCMRNIGLSASNALSIVNYCLLGIKCFKFYNISRHLAQLNPVSCEFYSVLLS